MSDVSCAPMTQENRLPSPVSAVQSRDISTWWSRFFPRNTNGDTGAANTPETPKTSPTPGCVSQAPKASSFYTKWFTWRKTSLGGYQKMNTPISGEKSTGNSNVGPETRESRNEQGGSDSPITTHHCLSLSSKLKKTRRNSQSTSGGKRTSDASLSNELLVGKSSPRSGSLVDLANQSSTMPDSASHSQASNSCLTDPQPPCLNTKSLLDTPHKTKPSLSQRSPVPTLSQALLADSLHLFEDSREMVTPMSIPNGLMSPADNQWAGRTHSPMPQPVMSHTRTRSLDHTSQPFIPGLSWQSRPSLPRATRSFDCWTRGGNSISPEMFSLFLQSPSTGSIDSSRVTIPWQPQGPMTPNTYNYIQRRRPFQNMAKPPPPPPSLMQETTTWPHEKALKAKQIALVKRSAEYSIYLSAVPRHQRTSEDPATPRIDDRQDWGEFQNKLREWRLAVNQRGHGFRLLQVVKQNIV